MTLELRFFASLRERVRTSEATRELPAGSTIEDLWQSLVAEFPAIAALGDSMSFAVNRDYVERRPCLADGDEVALIPPVSGG